MGGATQKRSAKKREYPGFVTENLKRKRDSQQNPTDDMESTQKQDSRKNKLPAPPTKVSSNKENVVTRSLPGSSTKEKETTSRKSDTTSRKSDTTSGKSNTTSGKSDGGARSFPMDTARFQRKVMLKFAQLQETVDTLSNQPSEYVDEGSKVFEVQRCITAKDLTAMENKLTDTKFKKKMLKRLSAIGGYDLKAVVKNVLTRVFDTELLGTMNMYGRGHKTGFMSLKISRVVIDSILLSNPKMTEAEIVFAVSRKLKYAPGSSMGLRKPLEALSHAQSDSEPSSP